MVESDTDDGSKLHEFDNGEEDVEIDSEDEVDQDQQTEDCDIGSLINSIKWNFEEVSNYMDDAAPSECDGPTGNCPGF